MPTHEEDPRFWRDWALLSMEQHRSFAKAMRKMVRDLKAGQGFRKGLRIVVGQPQAGERGRPAKIVCNAASSGWPCLRSVAK